MMSHAPHPDGVDPRELQVGDVFKYMIKDVLARPGDPLIEAGEWQVSRPEMHMGSHVGVDDEGRAYDVQAVTIHCRSLDDGREEPKIFPLDRKVIISRRQDGC